MRTRVKICGITRSDDALTAARLGADAIGLVFYPPSPRAVDVAQARAILAELPAFVTVVGLFVDAAPATVREVLEQLPLDLLQFHGEEDADYCRSFSRPYVKAISMREGVDLQACARKYGDARGLLLDAYSREAPGGTGKVFDWDRIPAALHPPLILAGGLTPDNAAQAVRKVRPYALDVSSGVERAPGIKDADKIAAFMRSVMSVEAK